MATNQRLFNGEDSVGRTLRIGARNFQVVGVLDEWHPTPKVYDLTQNSFGDPESLFMPFPLFVELDVSSAGNDSGWQSYNNLAEQILTESVFIQGWVHLPDAESKSQFQSWMDNYAMEQKKLGRYPRPINNKIESVPEYMEYNQVVGDQDRTLLLISALVLLVCILNVVGLILGKFLAQSGDIGVRRALGARRATIFYQYLVQAGILGMVGCVVALPATLGLLHLFKVFYGGDPTVFRFDPIMLLALVSISLCSALAAGLFPALRACTITPSIQLKTQ